jgi:hypothetical protein
MTLPKDWDKSKINTESERRSSLNTVKILKFIIPLVIIFIVWMVARSVVNSGFDEADRMLAQGCYYTSTDWLGVGKDRICP